MNNEDCKDNEQMAASMLKKISAKLYNIAEKIESEITCPYCNYEFTDSWEHNQGETEWQEDIECPECGKKFEAEKENRHHQM